MTNLIDLHCHCLPGVDDGVDNWEDSRELLAGLYELGFGEVVATPHMRPGLFDTPRDTLVETHRAAVDRFGDQPELPRVRLSCEHYFDDIVFERLCNGQGLPYPGGHAVLLEFYQNRFPSSLDRMLAQLRGQGLTPVVAHPERYSTLWGELEILERLLDLGAVALLDIAAVVGKYGRQPKRCAEKMLDRGLYFAACSDAHHPRDLAKVEAGMRWVEKRWGLEELNELLGTGPRDILAGKTED